MSRLTVTLAAVPAVSLGAGLVSVANQRLICFAAGYTPEPGMMVGIAAVVSVVAVIVWCTSRHG